jgi:hypothetical protein
MLGPDKLRGYCLEMICADFLAGANLENKNPGILLQSALRFFKFLPGTTLLRRRRDSSPTKHARLRLDPDQYDNLRHQVLRRDGWRCQSCGAISNLEVHHTELRSQSGDDSEPEPDHALHDMSRLHALQLRLTCAGFFATHVDEHGAKHIVISKLLGRAKLIITET